MKRSEALEVIEYELERLGLKIELSDIWARSLMAKIELEIKMLPPSHSCCILTRLPKERGEIDMYAWEPEHEA